MSPVLPQEAQGPATGPEDVSSDNDSGAETAGNEGAASILLSRRRTGGSVLPFTWDVPKLEPALEQELAKKCPLTSVWAKRLVKAIAADMRQYVTDM